MTSFTIDELMSVMEM